MKKEIDMKKIVFAVSVMALFCGISFAGPTRSGLTPMQQTIGDLYELRTDSTTYSTWTIVGVSDSGMADSTSKWSIKYVDVHNNVYWANSTSGYACQFDLVWSSRTTYNHGGK